MEDLASEFQEDFLEAVKVLEDFSSSDADLKEAMKEIRERIAARRYSCAPNFWEDLRETLRAIERRREEGSAKSKAQQVLKQIARLEVRFWSKESIGMLREMDAESRLERIVDWLQTFDMSDSADQSSGPAVLFQVLNDITLQKDMEQAQQELLAAAVRKNIGKFPVEMQAVLERVGSLQKRGQVVLGDWRRRGQVTAQEQPSAGGTRASFLPTPRLVERPGHLGSLSVPIFSSTVAAAAAPPAVMGAAVAGGSGTVGDPGPAAPGAALLWADQGATAATPAAEEDPQAEDEEAAANEPFRIEDVNPELLARAQKASLALLESNSGECPKHFVRALLKQVGVPGMPIAALGDAIFFSATEVFLRREGAAAPEPAATVRSAIPDEVRQAMVLLVREAGGRLALAQLAERLQWHAGSVRHSMYGPLRRAVAGVPELIFEPKKVFTTAAARRFVAVLAPAAEQECEGHDGAEAALGAAQPYVGDAFVELLGTVRLWLQQADGALKQDAVLRLSKALGFKTRSVIAALAKDVFWSHPEAELEILLRSAKGKLEHPRPLPDIYLHQTVHQSLVAKIREMGAKAKADKLSAALGWNAKSDLKKTYGTLRTVLTGLRDVFFEPQKLFSKQSLDGLVEWPVNKNGRLGPQDLDKASPEHWTPYVDDQKLAGDPEWTSVKRQFLGTLMRNGGQCEVVVLRQLLYPVEGLELEALFEPGSDHDLSALLYWGRTSVCCRRPQAVVPNEGEEVPPTLREALVSMVRAQGTAAIAELRGALDLAGLLEGVDDAGFCNLLQRIPELFFMPDRIFLRHVVEMMIIEEATNPIVLEGGADASMGAAADVAVAIPGAGEPPAGATEPTVAAALPALKGAEASGDATASPLPPEAASGSGSAECSAADGGGAHSGGAGFFSFSKFTPGQEVPAAAAEEPQTKRPRHDTSKVRAAGAWAEEAPPWSFEGAGVVVRAEGEEPDTDAMVLRISGSTCRVRLLQSGEERNLTFPKLLPMAPKVGATVRVIGGDRSGCTGTLVGLAGVQGVVQIGTMSYETLPMAQLAVLAS